MQLNSERPQFAFLSGSTVQMLILTLHLLMPCGPASAACDEPSAAGAEVSDPGFDESLLEHWSLQPLQRVTPPNVRHEQFISNPIDRFIEARLEQQGLTLQPSADTATLAKRLTLVMTGLFPETESEPIGVKESGLRVDEVLQDPGYGERWAQHWLDIARFAETDGYEHDKLRPEAWRYRDWIIQALNDDVPYDRFVQLQIAGDLLSENPADAIATHFCLCGPDMPDLNLQEERRHVLLNEITATVGEVILGLQLGCAQCHDHKTDPISQADFYRLRAVFEPAVAVKKNVSLSTLEGSQRGQLIGRVMLRGDFRRPGVPVTAAPLRAVRVSQTASEKVQSFDRRQLAVWLTSPQNPLTARVIVNRVWQQHFGRGLCEAPSDLGVMGFAPDHPELLDWLAGWFMDQGWSLKKLHRLVLTSSVWRQRSFQPLEASEEERQQWQKSLQLDPDTILLSRFPRKRLEGEVLRDVLLQAAGMLNRKRGGPGIRPPLPEDIRRTLLRDQWQVTPDASEHSRRSIYVFARRNQRYPLFEVFDRPTANLSCARRQASTTAPQSLFLMNSEFSAEIARNLAAAIRADHSESDKQVEQAFRKLLRRLPSREEQMWAGEFLSQSETDALASLCLTLFNSSEFLYVD